MVDSIKLWGILFVPASNSTMFTWTCTYVSWNMFWDQVNKEVPHPLLLQSLPCKNLEPGCVLSPCVSLVYFWCQKISHAYRMTSPNPLVRVVKSDGLLSEVSVTFLSFNRSINKYNILYMHKLKNNNIIRT